MERDIETLCVSCRDRHRIPCQPMSRWMRMKCMLVGMLPVSITRSIHWTDAARRFQSWTASGSQRNSISKRSISFSPLLVPHLRAGTPYSAVEIDPCDALFCLCAMISPSVLNSKVGMCESHCEVNRCTSLQKEPHPKSGIGKSCNVRSLPEACRDQVNSRQVDCAAEILTQAVL